MIDTEKRAWLVCAALWDEPETDEHEKHSAWVVVEEPRVAYGLCGTIAQLWNAQMITGEVAVRMKMVLQDVKKEDVSGGSAGFYWPTDVDGAKMRAAFCRKCAERC